MAHHTGGRGRRLVGWLDQWRKPAQEPQRRAVHAAIPAASIDGVAQEVYLRLLRYDGDTAADNPQSYLVRIAANVANEWRERSAASGTDGQDWLEELRFDSIADDSDGEAGGLSAERLRKVVEALPARQREVLLLHVNDGLTYKQIAERLKLAPSRALSELAGAYSELRVKLAAEDP